MDVFDEMSSASGIKHIFSMVLEYVLRHAVSDCSLPCSKQFGSDVEKYHVVRHFIPVPDTYLDLQSKTFALLEHGYSLGASYIAKSDDDVCVNPEGLLEGIDDYEKNRKEGDALYAGYGFFEGAGVLLLLFVFLDIVDWCELVIVLICIDWKIGGEEPNNHLVQAQNTIKCEDEIKWQRLTSVALAMWSQVNWPCCLGTFWSLLFIRFFCSDDFN